MDDNLKAAARDAARRAYCPYSKFPVGAALQTDDGKTFSGCNIENAAYGLTCCAERNAIFKAISEGVASGSIRRLAIYTPGERLYTPCGSCRQVMVEHLHPDAEVVTTCDSDESLRFSAAELLPQPFSLSEVR